MTQQDRDEFILLKADVKEIKDNQEIMSRKVESLIEKASKPVFTPKEMLGVFISIITYVVIVSFFISDISALANSNKEKIEKDMKVNEIILEKVNAIAIDVAVVKNEQKKLNENK